MTEPRSPEIDSTVERMLPLYEGKMIHHFDPRWATYESDAKTRDMTDKEKSDRSLQPLPRYWVRESVVLDRLLRDDTAHVPDWLLGFRDICRNTDERTVISSLLPVSAVGHTLPLIISHQGRRCLVAVLNSFALDFIARFKISGTHLTYFILEQLPILPPRTFERPTSWNAKKTYAEWITERVDFLMEGPWDVAQRAETRAELDALMFYLYGMDEDDIEYIMGTFPIVQRKDEEEHGEYRTKRLILEKYGELFG